MTTTNTIVRRTLSAVQRRTIVAYPKIAMSSVPPGDHTDDDRVGDRVVRQAEPAGQTDAGDRGGRPVQGEVGGGYQPTGQDEHDFVAHDPVHRARDDRPARACDRTARRDDARTDPEQIPDEDHAERLRECEPHEDQRGADGEAQVTHVRRRPDREQLVRPPAALVLRDQTDAPGFQLPRPLGAAPVGRAHGGGVVRRRHRGLSGPPAARYYWACDQHAIGHTSNS